MNQNYNNQLLNRVYETGFALDEATLFLDTHPEDRDAMEYYRCVRQANKEAVRAYEKAYGPLFITDVDESSWNWINSPWPWEGGTR